MIQTVNYLVTQVIVQEDTTMRERSLVPSSRSQSHTHPLPLQPEHQLMQPEVTRNFCANEIDLDDLAEAIRQLLHPESDAKTRPMR